MYINLSLQPDYPGTLRSWFTRSVIFESMSLMRTSIVKYRLNICENPECLNVGNESLCGHVTWLRGLTREMDLVQIFEMHY